MAHKGKNHGQLRGVTSGCRCRYIDAKLETQQMEGITETAQVSFVHCVALAPLLLVRKHSGIQFSEQPPRGWVPGGVKERRESQGEERC